ncbi:MAG: hypothetical protein RIA98_02785 [Algiphilus sp.]|uniref:hypothetical protein n=1 Tax=Algiphilus sp. TaxID=1872431 RepID=UPI0032EF28DE
MVVVLVMLLVVVMIVFFVVVVLALMVMIMLFVVAVLALMVMIMLFVVAVLALMVMIMFVVVAVLALMVMIMFVVVSVLAVMTVIAVMSIVTRRHIHDVQAVTVVLDQGESSRHTVETRLDTIRIQLRLVTAADKRNGNEGGRSSSNRATTELGATLVSHAFSQQRCRTSHWRRVINTVDNVIYSAALYHNTPCQKFGSGKPRHKSCLP